jgi:hypothetical protein
VLPRSRRSTTTCALWSSSCLLSSDCFPLTRICIQQATQLPHVSHSTLFWALMTLSLISHPLKKHRHGRFFPQHERDQGARRMRLPHHLSRPSRGPQERQREGRAQALSRALCVFFLTLFLAGPLSEGLSVFNQPGNRRSSRRSHSSTTSPNSVGPCSRTRWPLTSSTKASRFVHLPHLSSSCPYELTPPPFFFRNSQRTPSPSRVSSLRSSKYI